MCLYPEQQAEYDHLVLRFSEFAEQPWPPVSPGLDIEGNTLALLVPDMELLIESYLRKRSASHSVLNELQDKAAILERNLTNLPVAARPYFECLIELARSAMNLARQDSRPG